MCTKPQVFIFVQSTVLISSWASRVQTQHLAWDPPKLPGTQEALTQQGSPGKTTGRGPRMGHLPVEQRGAICSVGPRDTLASKRSSPWPASGVDLLREPLPQ